MFQIYIAIIAYAKNGISLYKKYGKSSMRNSTNKIYKKSCRYIKIKIKNSHVEGFNPGKIFRREILTHLTNYQSNSQVTVLEAPKKT